MSLLVQFLEALSSSPSALSTSLALLGGSIDEGQHFEFRIFVSLNADEFS